MSKPVYGNNLGFQTGADHDESLIVFLGEKDECQYLYPKEFHAGFFRFSAGIEDKKDLIEDIEQALQRVAL